MTPRKETTGIIIHCSATPPDMDIGSAEIERMHRRRGFATTGYHYVIPRTGGVQKGRNKHLVGAHCKAGGMNRKTIGVCLVGGVAEDGMTPQDNFTDAQWDSLGEVIDLIQEEYSEATMIRGHNEIPGVAKACPCFSVKEKVPEILGIEVD